MSGSMVNYQSQKSEWLYGCSYISEWPGLAHINHYIILNNGILKSNSSLFPRSEGYISQYTPWGVYGLILHEINEVNIILMIVKMI